MTPPAGWPALEKAAEEEDREQKQMLRNSLPGVPITILIEEGDIWTNLRAVTKRKDIDLLVIGTHGQSGIGKLLLGSVAEEILREAEFPVLTVGPHAPAQPNRSGELLEFSMLRASVQNLLPLLLMRFPWRRSIRRN